MTTPFSPPECIKTLPIPLQQKANDLFWSHEYRDIMTSSPEKAWNDIYEKVFTKQKERHNTIIKERQGTKDPDPPSWYLRLDEEKQNSMDVVRKTLEEKILEIGLSNNLTVQGLRHLIWKFMRKSSSCIQPFGCRPYITDWVSNMTNTKRKNLFKDLFNYLFETCYKKHNISFTPKNIWYFIEDVFLYSQEKIDIDSCHPEVEHPDWFYVLDDMKRSLIDRVFYTVRQKIIDIGFFPHSTLSNVDQMLWNLLETVVFRKKDVGYRCGGGEWMIRVVDRYRVQQYRDLHKYLWVTCGQEYGMVFKNDDIWEFIKNIFEPNL